MIDYRLEKPASIEELSEVLRGKGPFFVTGMGELKQAFMVPTVYSHAQQMDSLRRLDHAGHTLTAVAQKMLQSERHRDDAEWTRISTLALDGVVEYHPEDQVVVVRAGTRVSDLQRELAKNGQCLPLPDPEEFGVLFSGLPGTVGGSLSVNLPHALEAQCGSWREWVLGMTVVRADGSIAKAGSKAVKNVAGYDAHKLFVGARGTLGVVAEVILRTFPLKALPRPQLLLRRAWQRESLWIQRVLRSDFAHASTGAGDRLIGSDEATSTLWAAVKGEEELTRFAEDWVIRSGAGDRNVVFEDEAATGLMRRTKGILDPDGKLNPGAMGVV